MLLVELWALSHEFLQARGFLAKMMIPRPDILCDLMLIEMVVVLVLLEKYDQLGVLVVMLEKD